MTEWKLLPVPAADYDELSAVVTKRQVQRGEEVAPDADVISNDDAVVDAVRAAAYSKHTAWDEVPLARIAEGRTLTTQRWTTVMDLLAKNPGPGNELSTTRIVELTDLTLNEWRDACRKIRPHLEKNYPDAPVWDYGRHAGGVMWPVVGISGKELKQYDELYVGITEEQARNWLAVR